MREAIEDAFTARATEAEATGAAPRSWPTSLVAHPHWRKSFAAPAAGTTAELEAAVEQVNDWLRQLQDA